MTWRTVRQWIGVLLTFAVLAVALYVAWRFLDDYGILDAQTVGEPVVEQSTQAEEEIPAWAADAGQDLPPALAKSDEREPDLLLLESWVWDVVDETWALDVVAIGEGDGSDALVDEQLLVLTAPSGEQLLVTRNLRRDYLLEVVQWDPQDALAWIRRGGRSAYAAVIEYALVEGDTFEGWGDGTVPLDNIRAGVIVGVDFAGTLSDGEDVWEALTESGTVRAVFVRDGREWRDTLASVEISAQIRAGFHDSFGVYAWFDLDSGRAVYRAPYLASEDDSVIEERWLLHNLETDDIRDIAPQVPALNCVPVEQDAQDAAADGTIVAQCGSNRYVITLSGDAGPTPAG